MISSKPRRLLAVMFTDVVGYTALMQRDEEAARIVRRRHREVLEAAVSAHGGELFQYLGDGSVTMFPSVADAVRAAIEVQRGLRQEPVVPLRIGIHQGDISYDTQGAYGDAMNVAARIQSLGTTGSILISGKAHDEIKNQPDITTTPLGAFELKNVEESLEVYGIVADVLTVPTRDHVLTKIRSAAATESNATIRLNTALEGRYYVEGELGEGGMATVYLADDLKHERKVALKVLKPELAAAVGAERFLAEIKTTAKLTHPHILPLHDSGEADSFLFYVMPYVEGESLRERLDREHQLPVDEGVRIATAMGEALDYAHRQGVIHRDIKPANILLLEGKPVISDFGIALAVGAAGGGRLTETGLSLGTPHYMSPEQATGDQYVGPATDVYALGCVLFEMLVGEPPFTGSTPQAILGKIIAGKSVSASEERPSIPAHVDAALRCALEKLPADRFTSAQDFVRALGDEHFRYGETVEVGVGVAVGPWKRLSIGLAAVATIFAAAFGWAVLRPASPRPVTRVSVLIPEEQIFNPIRGDLDLSDDGSVLVYRGVGDEGQPQLWARRWDALEATPIRGTDGAGHPAISPDGQEVAFAQRGTIQVIPLQGGVSRTLGAGASNVPGWSPDGAWIFYTGSTGGVHRMPADGGPEEIITQPNFAAGEIAHTHMDVLPGGRKIVYHVLGTESSIGAADLDTGETKILSFGSYPRYSSTGHLLFLDDAATLVAASFDVDRFELTGTARPIAEQLTMLPNEMGFFDVSETGTLVYLTGGALRGRMTPVWVDRNGAAYDIESEWSVGGDPTYSSLALSPAGDRLGISILESHATYDLWVKQLDSGPLSRLTFEGAQNRRATWSQDGQSLTFISNRAGQQDLWTKRADGSGTAELVQDRERTIHEGFYSPDGTWLIFREGSTDLGSDDIYTIRPGVDSVAIELVATEFSENSPALSPNGRWLAYVSDRSGRYEVYVRPFPDAGASLQQVSADGGVEPVWAHSGRELFYRNGANELVAVQVTGDSTFTRGEQDVLFSMTDYLIGDGHPMYDVTPDDQRFVMLRIEDEDVESDTELILVTNWFEELRERMGN